MAEEINEERVQRLAEGILADETGGITATPREANKAQGVAIKRLKEKNEELLVALGWLKSRYEDTLAGRSVRDADEAIAHADVLLDEKKLREARRGG